MVDGGGVLTPTQWKMCSLAGQSGQGGEGLRVRGEDNKGREFGKSTDSGKHTIGEGGGWKGGVAVVCEVVMLLMENPGGRMQHLLEKGHLQHFHEKGHRKPGGACHGGLGGCESAAGCSW